MNTCKQPEHQLEIKHRIPFMVYRWPRWLNIASVLSAVPLLLVVSLWIVHQSESTLNANVASKLQTILQIESEAVRQWIKSELRLASVVSADVVLAELMLDAESGLDTCADELKQTLAEIASKLRNETCLLTSLDGKVLATVGESWLAEGLNQRESHYDSTRVSAQPTMTPVVRADPLVAGGGPFRWIVQAPIQHADRGVIGSLWIGYDAGTWLTEVVSSSRAGQTGETIAVTEMGIPISDSRFWEGPGALSFFPELHRDEIQTGSAAIKTDLTGVPDQRGAEIVFASRWMPRLGIGLITKMDRSEATAPIIRVRHLIWTLCGLLVLTTISTVFYRWYLYRLRSTAKQDELARKRLGPYEIAGKIGEGGMGVVYRANHALLRRPTAIKVLPAEKSDQLSIARFEREVRYTSQLKHPNTISIYDYGRSENGLFYYAMELLDGLNLEQLIDCTGSLPDGRVIEILRQVGQSLHEAHSKGLVHRDIKPANIMLCDHGGAYDTVKVLDFGLVRNRSTGNCDFVGNFSGTPNYMAPECFSSPASVDSRIDLFALGAVGFYLLTGKPLLQAHSLNELMEVHRSDIRSLAAMRLDAAATDSKQPISPELCRLISRCVSNEMHQRPASIESLMSELMQCQPRIAWDGIQAKNWWQSLNWPEAIAAPQLPGGGFSRERFSLDTTAAFETSWQPRTAKPDNRLFEYKIA